MMSWRLIHSLTSSSSSRAMIPKSVVKLFFFPSHILVRSVFILPSSSLIRLDTVKSVRHVRHASNLLLLADLIKNSFTRSGFKPKKSRLEVKTCLDNVVQKKRGGVRKKRLLSSPPCLSAGLSLLFLRFFTFLSFISISPLHLSSVMVVGKGKAFIQEVTSSSNRNAGFARTFRRDVKRTAGVV